MIDSKLRSYKDCFQESRKSSMKAKLHYYDSKELTVGYKESTSYEIVQLDLSNVDLLVMSACQTGKAS